MTVQPFALTKELFTELRPLTACERARRLAAVSDPSLASEVRELLCVHDRETSFLEESALASVIELAPDAPDALSGPLPVSIGGFRVREVLAFGASSVVYLAEQPNPLRVVALKVLRWDSASAASARRFAREALVLGHLEHPGIARIFASGVEETAFGPQPWLALEYVRGPDLVAFADERRLAPRERIRLLALVCDALHVAHESGVVHRDLKPQNILVDPAGLPRVLDFGIAQLSGAQRDSLHTRTGQVLGTLAYMSPEQAGADPHRVDARTDVYALGVLLHELLTGTLPIDTRDDLPHRAIARIREEEPLRLGRLVPELRGDLETIVAKALEKEPARRYPSARELALDLRRFLEHRPIVARPATTAYHVRKLVRRHRGLAGGIAIAFAALLAGLVAALVAFARTHDAERRVGLERDALRRLSAARGLAELEERADRLWPLGPETAPGLAAWVSEAEAITRSLPLARAYLAELRARPADSRAHGEARWLLADQEELVRTLERFAAPASESGLIATMRARLAYASSLERRTVVERRAGWTAAIAAIADRARHPLYRGLLIEPQVGLVPLGPDPRSGLWEFALDEPHGEIPRRGAARGELVVEAATSLVFVLLPGGELELGSQAEDPSAPGFDPRTSLQDGPRTSVAIGPYLLSKYEMTQAQWRRCSGSNPSMWEPGSRISGVEHTELHPVESVSWEEASLVLARLGLTLPTEAQWEYAARGGTNFAYGAGQDARVLSGATNELGVRPDEEHGAPASRACRGALDRWPGHAPIARFAANPYGLHDILGNVWELCADVYAVHFSDYPTRPGDGLRLADDDGHRSRRGASYASPCSDQRVAWRADVLCKGTASDVGVRPARALSGRFRFAP